MEKLYGAGRFWMGEKTRLTAMAAVFIALSLFCWGTSVWSAGQSEGLAYQTDGASLAQKETTQMTADFSAAQDVAGQKSAAADSDTGVEATSEIQQLSDTQALALGQALAAAGTPYFDNPSQLTAPQLEEVVLWYLMETGGMPEAVDGQVLLPAAEVWQLAGELFGVQPDEPEDCTLATYDREQDAFILTAGVCIPKSAAVSESVEQEDNRSVYRMQLYPPDGWEGDVLGNEYRPNMTAAAVLLLEDGRFAGWSGG